MIEKFPSRKLAVVYFTLAEARHVKSKKVKERKERKRKSFRLIKELGKKIINDFKKNLDPKIFRAVKFVGEKNCSSKRGGEYDYFGKCIPLHCSATKYISVLLFPTFINFSIYF